MELQERERKDVLEREMVRVLHEKEELVREMAKKKKCVIISGMHEENSRN